ncbi:type VI secretion system protein ImpL [Duganella sp. 1411]|uniref:type VI secretion system membrane subunit TssM n=1 Tax=Duganella sp. 1411 TaxID=2806572 RepID=UPI001AE26680|nr:type VI secretion system membrane subunit TssM [Duganella sp. 1411]MBP1202771.1 type VI secretion system protein ImpL [Duganella sp. 1411]
MKKLFSWLMKPWVLSLLGVLLLSLLVWFEGPLFAFDGNAPLAPSGARWFLILLLLSIWAAYFLWKTIAARLANRRLMASLAPPEESKADTSAQPPEALREQALLAARMRQAIDALRKAAPGKSKWGGQYLYQLPWYMFVGAPGSGKTTTLLHSGLTFPLAETLGPGAIGGVGGTRHCDWWFTDEAVLLDTAGRYTTQDSDGELDRAGWSGFLDLLKKHRPRRPVNGVIVAISVADLLQQGPAGRQAQALAIRARIKELHERLGSSFPIYVTVTKCDLLAGFVEFFDGLGREERAQVWGMTFPANSDDQAARALASFPQRFLALERQLQARVLERVQHERDLQRRALVYRFPQQFAAIGEVLGGFLNEVFQATRFERAALLRGVYFTSGTQEGSPIDRVMVSLASAFGLDRKVLAPNAASGRSYFITNLLRELMFKEAGLAGADRNFERNRRRLRWLAGGLAGLLLVLMAAGLATSYVRNQRYVNEMAARAAALERAALAAPAQGGVVALLPLLNAARDLPGGYAQRGDGVPLLNRFGLNQADKLGAGARTVYRRLLRATLLPRVTIRLEEVLRRGDANNQELLYETLRVYLMLGQPSHLDAESVQAWLGIDWGRNLPEASGERRDQLASHVAALLDADGADSSEPPVLDAGLIAQTRLTLAMMPLPQRVYNRLKRQVAQARLPEFSVNRAAGRDVSLLLARGSGEPLTRGIAGVYSVAGYRELLKQLPQAMLDIAKDSWVLDRREAEGALAAAGGEQMRAAVLQLYYADYIRQWDGLLADVRIVPFSSLEQGARVTNALAAADSPLRALLQAAARETKLDSAGAKPATAALDEAVRGKLAAARRKLESALGGEEAPPPDAKEANPVDQHFEALHKLVGAPGAPGAAPLDAMLAMLKDASQYFDAADGARRAGTPPPPADVMQRLKREADGKPAPLGGMLKNIDSAGAGLTVGGERARLQSLWNADGGPFCQAAIAGRYPLARSAAKEVTPDDFGRFFGPGGVMDDFFAKNLAAQVDMGGAQWKWRDSGVAPGVPQEVLGQFQRAARLRDMFFVGGGRQPSLRFELAALSADAAFSKISFDIDGQAVVYIAGAAARPVPISLPSGKAGGQMHLEAVPPLKADLRSDGPWAWFRMLDMGSLESSAQGERFKLTFDLDGRKVVYQLTASSVVNPFRREALEQFRCPVGW